MAKLRRRSLQRQIWNIHLLAALILLDIVKAPAAAPLTLIPLIPYAVRHHPGMRRIKRSLRREDHFDSLIAQAARKNHLDPLLIKAIIWVESEGDPYCISTTGAIGLMQIQPKTARHLRIKDVRNPALNIFGGTRHFKYMLRLFHGNLRHALAAYNAGEGPVRHFHGVPPFQETQAYVRRVLSTYRRYQLEAGLRPSASTQHLVETTSAPKPQGKRKKISPRLSIRR